MSRLQLVVRACLPDPLDLTRASVRSALAITRDEITQERDPLAVDVLGRSPAYKLPHGLGELANELGMGAILFPSSPAPLGVNVVIFTNHLTPTGSWHQVQDPVTGEDER